MGVSVCDCKRVYWLQISSEYSAGPFIAVNHHHFGSGYNQVLIMIGGVYNVGACYCVTVPASYPSIENLLNRPFDSGGLYQNWDIVTGHTVTVLVRKKYTSLNLTFGSESMTV